MQVTGVDASPGSLEHARRSAETGGLDIRYVEADYRALEEPGPYDAAILVYHDFGVLSPADRALVLDRVRRALREGGRFAFDAVGEAAPRREGTSWTATAGSGFWRQGPHLVLERRLDYPEAEVFGREYAVLDDCDATLYRIWEQRFSRDRVERELRAAGLELERLAADLTGTPWCAGSETVAVVARRPRASGIGRPGGQGDPGCGRTGLG